MARQKKICIVTPDIIGPIRNGGIGTACVHLARFLAVNQGHNVTILFTGPVENGSLKEWKAAYKTQHGVDLFGLSDCDPEPALPCHNGHWFIMRSLRIHDWLMRHNFEQIHFQEWQANGFIPVQAKRCGLAYGDTLLTCTLHSSTEWVGQGSQQFVTDPQEEMLLKYCERYAARNADVTVSPSHHMANWCQSKGWELHEPQIIPYLYEETHSNVTAEVIVPEELCFFGRLETRKGLEIYLAALGILLARPNPPAIPRLTFLGKCGQVLAGRADAVIKRFGSHYGIATTIIDSLQASEAIAYLRENPRRVAVMPSLLDNYPYTVLECLQNGIRFIASDVGGIPEMVSGDSHLFAPTPRALALKLDQVLAHGIGPVPAAYCHKRSRDLWKELVYHRAATGPKRLVEPGDITICVAHFNYGRYLPGLLKSLERQTVQGFSVVVVDDGSTDLDSLEVFRGLAARHSKKANWTFVEKPNGGIGETRNHAASLAKTDFLVFMDADNEAERTMIEVMARSMSFNPVDCLTCYMRGFKDAPPDAPRELVYHYVPTGPCLEAGVFTNCFGDANFIIRAAAFWAVGGFGLRRDASFEDWEFLARLALEGFTQDVIPKPLFLYRHTPGGFSRTTSSYLNHMRIVDAYGKKLPAWAHRILADVYLRVSPHVALSVEKVSMMETPVNPSPNKPGLLRTVERAIRRRRKRLLAKFREGRQAATLSDNYGIDGLP